MWGKNDGDAPGRYNRLSVWLLSVLGVYILVAPWLAPELLHWNRITASVGGEAAFVRIALGVLFIYFATLTHEKYVLKKLNRDLVEAFNVAMYGEHYRQHRATVETLIESMASSSGPTRDRAHRALRTMTGQALPAESATWSAWWSQAKHTFRLSENGGLSEESRQAAQTEAARAETASV